MQDARPDRTEIHLHLDPTEAAHAKNRRQYRLNVVDYPAARVMGNALIVVGVAPHTRFILGDFDPGRFTAFAVALTLYSLLSWLALALFWTRVRRIDLGDVFGSRSARSSSTWSRMPRASRPPAASSSARGRTLSFSRSASHHVRLPLTPRS